MALPIASGLSLLAKKAPGHMMRMTYATIEKHIFPTTPYKLHKLDTAPPKQATITRKDALNYYRDMYTIRTLERKLSIMYQAKLIRGFCHLCSGQEAVSVGAAAVMRENDIVTTSYRCHGWAYMLGCTPAGICAELASRKTGSMRGKGGSMHLYTRQMCGGQAIVGATAPLGTGIGFAIKYRKQKNVSLTLYGDGAANQGQVFESFNIAKLWNLPVLYLCENNEYGMGTSTSRSSASTDYYTRGDYIPGLWVDGMDVLSVREGIRFAMDWCDSGKGPIVVEANTYRYFGHSMSDPGKSYRTHKEVSAVRKTRDPITTFSDKVIKANLVTNDELKKIKQQVDKIIEDSAEFAKKSEETPPGELAADVVCNVLPWDSQVRNCNHWQPLALTRIGAALHPN